jgi:hypothetical protein
MTPEEYAKTTLAQMQLRRWVTTTPMRNGNFTIPAGHPVKITSKISHRLTLEGAPCDRCGVGIFVSHVRPSDVKEVP